MHNQHIARIVQDVQASSGPKELFINLPELHSVNSQKNQGCGHIPRQRSGIWNNKGSIRETNACSYLGYSVSKEGIAPNPKHVEKIKIGKPPSNMKQLESFVGLANFYGRMIPDFATKMLPVNEIRKEEFRWDKEMQNAFKKQQKRVMY